jgi:hypothetical protein
MTARSLALPAAAFVALAAAGVARTPADWRGEWDHETSLLVSNSVYRKVTRGWSAPLGYPFDADAGATDRAANWASDRTDRNYYKQFGLAVYALAAAAPRDPAAMERMLLAARYAAAVATAAVGAVLVGLLARRCGPAAGLALAAFVAADPRYTSFFHSLYWLPGLSLIPLVVVLTGYAQDQPPRRFRRVLALFGAAVCVKALCGYEHISTVVLVGCAGVVFNGWPAGWRVLLRHATWVVVAGGCGTVLALVIHAASLYASFGSVDEVVRNTAGSAFRRSFGTHEAVAGTDTLRGHLFGVYGLLAQHKFVTVLLGLWVAALAVRAIRPRWQSPALDAAAAASVVAFLAGCSWLVLMRVHVALAPQYNGLVFYHGFVWFAAPFVAAVARRAVAGPPAGGPAPLGLDRPPGNR